MRNTGQSGGGLVVGRGEPAGSADQPVAEAGSGLVSALQAVLARSPHSLGQVPGRGPMKPG